MNTSSWLDYAPPADLLAGRVILVTGAYGGIGAAASKAYAKHGATVVLLGRRVKPLEKLYDEIEAAGGPTPAIVPLDLANADDRAFEHVAGMIEKELGRLDGILHTAAAFFPLGPLELAGSNDWQTLFRVNTIAPFGLMRACQPLLKAAPDASVIALSETHAARATAYWGGFAASMAAREHAFMTWADEWERFEQLRVNLLVPGPLDSPCRSRTHPGEDRNQLRRIDEIVPALLYLMGPVSREVRGQRVVLG